MFGADALEQVDEARQGEDDEEQDRRGEVRSIAIDGL